MRMFDEQYCYEVFQMEKRSIDGKLNLRRF
jgi:hypothetical protein